MARWTSRLATVVIKDQGGSIQWTVGPGPGDLSIGAENAENAEHVKKLDRGQHDGFVLGDDMVQDVSISIELPNVALTDPLVGRAHDVFKKQGAWAAATSVDPTIWAFVMEITLTDGVTTTTKTLPIVEGEGSFAEAKEGSTFNFAGRNHGPIVEA
jgi:hypothetical protein